MYWGKNFYKNFQIWADAIQDWHPEKIENLLTKAWDFLEDYSPKIINELTELIGNLSEEKIKEIAEVIIKWLRKAGLLKK